MSTLLELKSSIGKPRIYTVMSIQDSWRITPLGTIPSCGPYERIRARGVWISLYFQLLNSAQLTVQIESSCGQDFYCTLLQFSCSWTYWNPTYGYEVDNLNQKGAVSWVETNFSKSTTFPYEGNGNPQLPITPNCARAKFKGKYSRRASHQASDFCPSLRWLWEYQMFDKCGFITPSSNFHSSELRCGYVLVQGLYLHWQKKDERLAVLSLVRAKYGPLWPSYDRRRCIFQETLLLAGRGPQCT